MTYLLILLSLFSLPSVAQTAKLVARASDSDGFPAAAMCFFSNNDMAIHKDQLLVHYTCLSQNLHDELWIGDKKILQSSPGNLLNTAVSDGRNVFVTEYGEFGTQRLWQYDGARAEAHALPVDWNEVQIHGLAPLPGERLRFSMTNNQGMNHEGEWTVGEWKLNDSRGVSYFFSAAANEFMHVQKVRLGEAREWSESRPDEIRIALAPHFQAQTVVRDHEADASSPYLGFFNFTTINGERWAVLSKTKNGIVALVGDRADWRELPLYPFFADVEMWSPAITASGKFVLRATHKNGTRGLWIFDESEPRLLLKVGDILATDRGDARVSKELFYNAPITHGEAIFIGVGLEQFATGTSLGQGIFEFSSR